MQDDGIYGRYVSFKTDGRSRSTCTILILDINLWFGQICALQWTTKVHKTPTPAPLTSHSKTPQIQPPAHPRTPSLPRQDSMPPPLPLLIAIMAVFTSTTTARILKQQPPLTNALLQLATPLQDFGPAGVGTGIVGGAVGGTIAGRGAGVDAAFAAFAFAPAPEGEAPNVYTAYQVVPSTVAADTGAALGAARGAVAGAALGGSLTQLEYGPGPVPEVFGFVPGPESVPATVVGTLVGANVGAAVGSVVGRETVGELLGLAPSSE